MADLSTCYLGLNLKNPLILAASGLSGTAEGVKKAAQAGAGAVILKSLFEEQLSAELASAAASLEGAHPEAAEFFSRDPHAGSLRTLFWGRLEPDNATGPHELSFRMALAAYQSPGWDKNRGRARNGDNNGFVKDLANRAMIYPELKALFTRFHRSVYFSCAEKVLVVRASKLPFYDQLKRHGVKATDKLPFDCMAWFAVSESAESR